MATVRTELVFDTKTGQVQLRSLGGDLEELEKKTKKSGGAMTSIFQGVGQAVGQHLFKAFSGAADWIGGAATAAIKWSDSMGLSADKMGVTAESAQKLKFVADQLDIPFATLEKSMGKMTVAMTKTPEAFTRLGISMSDIKKASPEEQLAMVADKLSGLKDPTEFAAAASAIFGKNWQELAPLLREGGEAIRVLGADAERLGAVMDNDVIASGRDMDDTLTKLNAVWDGLIRNFGAAITTSEPLHRLIEGLVEIFGGLSKGVQDGQSDLRAFVDGGVILAANALVYLVKGISVAVDLWTAFKIAVLLANTVVEQSIVWAKASAEAIMHPTRALEIFKKAQAEHNAITQRGIAEAKAEIQTNIERQNKILGLEVEVQKLAKFVTEADGATHKATKSTRDHSASLGESAKAAEKAAQAEQKLVETMEKAGRAALHAMANDMDKHVAMLAKQQEKRVMDDLEASTKIRDARLEIEREMEQAEIESAKKVAEARKEAHEQFISDLFTLGDSLLSLGHISEKAFGQMVGGLMAGAAAAKQFAEATNGAQQVQSVLNVGVNAYRSSALGGAAAGAAFGASFGPIGAGVGAVVGGLLGFIGSNKRAQEEMKKLRGEFIESRGGMEELTKQAALAGVSLDSMFQAKTADDLKRAIKGIKKELDTWTEAHEKTKEAAERYGLTIEELGPKFRNQQLHEMAGQLYQDFNLLKASGADMAAVMTKMGPATSDWLNTALRAGGEIPIAMKPMLLDMARHGSLLKESGEAYTVAEVEGMSFANTMSQMFTDLIKKVDDLISAMLGIPNVHRTVTIEQRNGGGDGPPPPGEESVPVPGRGRRQRPDGEESTSSVVFPTFPSTVSLTQASVRDIARAVRDGLQLTGT